MKVEINQKLSTSCSRQVHKVLPAIWFCSVSLTMQDVTQGCTFYSRLSYFWFLREMLVLQTIRCSLPNPQPQGRTAGHLFDCMKKKKKRDEEYFTAVKSYRKVLYTSPPTGDPIPSITLIAPLCFIHLRWHFWCCESLCAIQSHLIWLKFFNIQLRSCLVLRLWCVATMNIFGHHHILIKCKYMIRRSVKPGKADRSEEMKFLGHWGERMHREFLQSWRQSTVEYWMESNISLLGNSWNRNSFDINGHISVCFSVTFQNTTISFRQNIG